MRKKRIAVLAVCCILLLVFVVLKFDGSWARLCARIREGLDDLAFYGTVPVNLVPLRTIGRYAADLPGGIAVRNLVGNLVLWAPVGLLGG